MKTISLGDLTPQKFLHDYWQKKPLLVRNAMPGFEGLLTRDALIKLACQEDAQSRLILRQKEKWQVKYGPLNARNFVNLHQKQWTLLVHDVNHFFRSARELLLKFSFVPYSRLDDLMVSYAPKGGGIGPHFDSYDVFLLQGMGSRRWQISARQHTRLLEDAPLKILKHFYPEEEWVLESGDMLYLPPNYAHNGIAENDCMTYSIGFRAPSNHELVTQFLVYLQDHVEVDGWYCDPGIELQPDPARISQAMLSQVQAILNKVKWNLRDIENFLGIYLTEPKPHVFFRQPAKPLERDVFIQQIMKTGIELNLKSRMLYDDKTVFLNGDAYFVSLSTYQVLTRLADQQILISCNGLISETENILYQWYLNGYIVIMGTNN